MAVAMERFRIIIIMFTANCKLQTAEMPRDHAYPIFAKLASTVRIILHYSHLCINFLKKTNANLTFAVCHNVILNLSIIEGNL